MHESCHQTEGRRNYEDGIAAALCAKACVMPRQLPVADLQDALRADGVVLDMKDRDQAAL